MPKRGEILVKSGKSQVSREFLFANEMCVVENSRSDFGALLFFFFSSDIVLSMYGALVNTTRLENKRNDGTNKNGCGRVKSRGLYSSSYIPKKRERERESRFEKHFSSSYPTRRIWKRISDAFRKMQAHRRETADSNSAISSPIRRGNRERIN